MLFSGIYRLYVAQDSTCSILISGLSKEVGLRMSEFGMSGPGLGI